jgi:hypothetical protein
MSSGRSFAPFARMNETLRRFAMSGLETQKQGLAVRFRRAATTAREDVSRPEIVNGLVRWLADGLDSAATTIESRDAEQWLREGQALARRHPAATAALAAGAAFLVARLTLPWSGRETERGPARRGAHA